MVLGPEDRSRTWTPIRLLDAWRAITSGTTRQLQMASAMNLDELTQHFATAHPALVCSRSLHQRVDRKFLLSEPRLPSLLSRLQPSFSALTAGSTFWAQ